MSKFEPRPFIYSLDFLSGTPGVFISGYKNFSTLFGLLTTIIISAISLAYVLYEFYLFYFEREMSVVELQDNFMTKETNISLNDFLFAFNVFNVNMTINYFYGKEINLKSGNNTREPINQNFAVILYYENPETKEIINRYQLDVEYCEIGKNINQKIIDQYNFTEYKNYLCLSNKSSNFDLIINKTYNTYIDIVVSIFTKDSDDYGLNQIYSDLSKIIYKSRYIEFQLYSPDDIISNKNETNPIKFRKNYLSYELVSPGVLEHNEISTNFIDYSSDNAFVFKNKQNFKGLTLNAITKTTKNLERFPEVQNMIYSEFRLYLNPDTIESYERTYKKLPDIIADITGVFSLLFTAGKIYVFIFCQIFLKIETLSRTFRLKFNSSSKNKLKKYNKNIKIQNNLENESSQRDIKNNLISSISQQSKIVNNRNKKINNNIEVDNQNNELGLINNSSKNKLINNSNCNPPKKNKEHKIKINNLGNIDNIKDNNTNSLNNNASKKNKLKKFNSTQYSEVLFKMIERYNIGKQKKCITFFFCYYLPSIFNRNKNNKTKIIEKISAFFEDSLSIEEIIGRKIDLENLIYFIRKKLGKESNLTNYIKILIHKDNEFKQIIEDENKNIIVNNLIKQNN